MLSTQEVIGKLAHERLAREARAARMAKAAGPAGRGLAQRAVHSAGETFVALGNWMKQVSQSELSGDHFEIRYNH